ncbi:MAG: DUF167 domain-containing protein [Pseudomonadota bacterium]
MADPATWDEGRWLLKLTVQPRASRDEIVGLYADTLRLRTTAPPVDGKANRHIQRWLAKQFGVAPSCVELVSGRAGRSKRFAVNCPRDTAPDWLKTYCPEAFGLDGSS